MDKLINEDIKNIDRFLKKRPNILGCYCCGINDYYNKKNYRLIIVVEDIWKWQQDNRFKNEFTIYANSLYSEGYNFIDYLGIKDGDCIFDYTLMNGSEFIEDLLYWKNYTFANMFQNLFIPIKSSDFFDNVIKRNQSNALIVSLLKLNKNNAHFFDIMVNYYALLNGLSNDVFNFVNVNYNRLKLMFENSKYLKINNSDNILINNDLVKNDIVFLPRRIKELIISSDTTFDISNVVDYLKNKILIEKDCINDMRFLANGTFKTILYNSRDTKVRGLRR